jgi:hypothetical protein
VIAEVSRSVRGFRAGDRVSIEPGVPCLSCDLCREGCYNLCPDVHFTGAPPYDGMFRDFLAHDPRFVYRIPDQVTFTQAALAEPLSVAHNAAAKARLRSALSASHSTPFGGKPSIKPRMPLPWSVAPTSTCRGLAVAPKIRQTSWKDLTWLRTLMGVGVLHHEKEGVAGADRGRAAHSVRHQLLVVALVAHQAGPGCLAESQPEFRPRVPRSS